MSRVKEEIANAVVTTTEGNTALATEIADPYAAAIAAMDETLPLIKCGKDGVWWAGDNEVTCRAVVAMPTVSHGYHRWCEGELIDQVVVPMTEPMPKREDLDEDPDSDEWGEMRSVELRLMDNTDEEYLFSGSSNGIRKAVNSLVKKWRNRDRAGAPVLPVVEFAYREYQHKQYGPIREPVFKIVAWMTEDQLFAEVYGDHQVIAAGSSGQGQVGDAVADDLDDEIPY